MDRSTRYCLLACVLAVCLGSLGVYANNNEPLMEAYNGGLLADDFTDEEEATEVLQNMIDQYLGGEAAGSRRDLRDSLALGELDSGLADDQKRAGRCRGTSKCIMRGPNPNTSSRVLPFGKRGSAVVGTLARRGRGSSKNSRARGGRTILPFGRRR